MKNQSKIDFDFVGFLASEFAKNKNKWWKWFEVFAKKYHLRFLDNQEKLLEIFNVLNQKSASELTDLEFEKAHRIYNYLLLFQAIKINDKQEVSLNETIINKFKKVRSKKENQVINDAVQQLNGELKIENDDLNLDDWFKISLLFYKEDAVRESFFINFIGDEKQEWNLNDFSLVKKTNFANYPE